jgi:hypothetical protein
MVRDQFDRREVLFKAKSIFPDVVHVSLFVQKERSNWFGNTLVPVPEREVELPDVEVIVECVFCLKKVQPRFTFVTGINFHC